MQLGSWRHLAGRFFEVATAGKLNDAERTEVEGWLTGDAEAAVYWDQSAADQRHGWESARMVAGRHPDRRDLIRAALLHDIGKRHARLGPLGRSLATVCGKFRIPVAGAWQRYLRHGALGAEDLAALGCEELVVEFARSHHHARPPGISPHDWETLQAADR
jgi:putative nucleotidyltransferase with HDIG domain